MRKCSFMMFTKSAFNALKIVELLFVCMPHVINVVSKNLEFGQTS